MISKSLPDGDNFPPMGISKSIGRDNSQRPGRGGSANKNTINFFGMSKDRWIGIVLGVSIIANVFLIFEYRNLERETRMLEYYLLELDAKFIGAGLKKPEDAISKHLQESKK